MATSIDQSLLLLTAKPVRPGHYQACSPTNPFFIRGYSDQPIASCNDVFHNSNNQEAAVPAAPQIEHQLPEANSNQNSPSKQLGYHNSDTHDNDVQNNM